MPDATLPAHSLAEAFFYVMVTRCPACKDGGLKAGNASVLPSTDGVVLLTIPAECSKCKSMTDLLFTLPEAPPPVGNHLATVNSTADPSRIIDLAQWITLAHVIIEAASKEPSKQQARHLGMEAAQCLEEAIKFFRNDNDLPEPTAFFSAESRVRFDQAPQKFSRQRLVNQRAKLPTIGTMRTSLAAAPRKKKWWFW